MVGNRIFPLDHQDIFKYCLNRFSWKMVYTIILTNNTYWISSKLFVWGKGKLGPLGRRHLHHLFITELLLVWSVGHMDPHATDWVTKPSHMPWTGNLAIFKVVIHFNLLLTYSPQTVNSIVVLHKSWYIQRHQKG